MIRYVQNSWYFQQIVTSVISLIGLNNFSYCQWLVLKKNKQKKTAWIVSVVFKVKWQEKKKKKGERTTILLHI